MTKDDMLMQEDYELIKATWDAFVDDVHSQALTHSGMMYILGQFRGIQFCSHYSGPTVLAGKLAKLVRESITNGPTAKQFDT